MAGRNRTRIPATIKDAVNQLNGLGDLLTAKEWERAAIVYAFTRDGTGRDNAIRSETTTDGYTARQFADLGITGLKSDATVRIYRKAWQAAIDADKAKPVSPGDEVSEPDMSWPPTDPRTGNFQKRVATQYSNAGLETQIAGFVRAVEDNPDFLEALAEAHPEVAELVAKAVGSKKLPTPDKAKEFTLISALGDIEDCMASAASSVTRAISVVERTIAEGFVYNDMEYRGMAAYPEEMISPRLEDYRKLLGMVATEAAEVPVK